MIEKMKFLSITGPKEQIDRVTEQYLSKYEMHLENALSELKTVKELTPFIEPNPYKSLRDKAHALLLEIPGKETAATVSLSREKAVCIIENLDAEASSIRDRKIQLENEGKDLRAQYETVLPFRGLDFNIEDILKFSFTKFRFGRFAMADYRTFKQFVYDDLDTIFYPCYSDSAYVWGIFFVPQSEFDKIDTIYSSLHFESTFLSEKYTGTPQEICSDYERLIKENEEKVAACKKELAALLDSHRQELISAKEKMDSLISTFDIRKMAACTRAGHNMFFILCGWMTNKDALAFLKEVREHDPDLYCVLEDEQPKESEHFRTPPTKLKNPKLFRPFEMFIRMYGMPAYNEFDPTVFVALTYAFIFGAMFGDAGQGLCLIIGGFLIYRFKKSNLAAVISIAGIFSTIFGVLYGSFFGFENVIKPLWLTPMKATMTLPVVGNLNVVLVVSVALGMGLILVSMLFNIYNGIKSRDIGKIVFDTNGVLGIIFYGSAVATIVLYMSGHALPATIILMIAFIVPLILLLFKEPIINLLERKKETLPGGPVMYLVQSIFELFEVVLSYLTNTISFVRIGAFALSHAGMMQVVLMLAGAENGGSPNWPVVVIGNIFVAGMEGLIVGIHVLRLEYYEMFSRYFSGSGREFKPFKTITNK
ncbi:V-type ATP synthase subunit I [Qiania dongpingensis]|uniref:ATPase n=1 Tax=Qiania dongpingensis TaxID=2763669 RepID=A0A7G9G0U5_9FIRM|nr:V-type ATPase 116kDa subunit family protein [Qiania dongpingensis]QNM04427.1 ATPase [Qiania dongpingensis]